MELFAITLTGTPDSIGEARAFVARHLDAHPRSGDAVLMVSEVATNAVRHTRSGLGGSYKVLVGLTIGTVRVEVQDQGGETVPCPKQDSGDREGGRGVAIVDMLADQWGYDPARRVFWFELAAGHLVTIG